MTLAAHTRLGPYQILEPLGSGGMGEVYRARDTRLERDVAIKILPPQFSNDPLRKQRFEREAKTISNLNHPNICVLHDIGHQDGIDYLVMECVQGETLESRLRKGPLPIDQVLRLGIQMADALDRAHRSGVVHRDLKPGNIMVTSSGAKLLDFGLAKAMASPSGGSSLSALATQLSPVTEQGMIVGTFQYMAPEQVEGREADGRSDLFSLGAVLYEMTIGRPAFAGKSQLSVASAILEKEPEPMSALKPMTPPAFEHAIGRCLAKDPEERWQTGRDLAHELKWAAEAASRTAPGAVAAAPAAGGRARRPLMVAALILSTVAAATFASLYATRAPVPSERVTRTHIKPMPGASFALSDGAGFELSPDGRSLAYVAAAGDGRALLWLRSIDSLNATPLPETSGATYPFWSPDSRFIGFFAGAKLKKIAVAGGPPLTLADASDGRGAAWNQDGDIIFAPGVNAALHRIPESGGSATPITTLDLTAGELSHRWPQFLPDGRHYIFLAGSVFTSSDNPTNTIRVGSLDSKESRILLRSHAGARYASGRLLYMRQGTLMAQPFDPAKLEISGSPVPLGKVEVTFIFSRALFSASDNGLLAYIEGGATASRELLWYDRSGKPLGILGEDDAFASPRLSPDGKRVLFYLDRSGYDVWTYDLVRGVKSPQTFGSATGNGNLYAVWSPDGSRIAYGSFRLGKHSLAIKPSDGSSGEQILVEAADRYKFPTDWSPDGQDIVYQQGKEGGWEIWLAPVGGDRKPYRFHEAPFSEREAVFSPDGRWIAYCSNESGEYRVYAAPFPGPGGKWQVSEGPASSPRWRRDGREIFYLSSDNKLMAVDVRVTPSALELSSPRALFETRPYGVFARFDVSADGQRFIVAYDKGMPATAITLVVNWLADLKP